MHSVLGFPSNKFAIGFVTYTTDGSSTRLKVGPTLIVRLGFVKGNSVLALVHLVKPKFVALALVPQDIESNAPGLLTGLDSVVFDHFHKFIEAIFLDYGLHNDREWF